MRLLGVKSQGAIGEPDRLLSDLLNQKNEEVL